MIQPRPASPAPKKSQRGKRPAAHPEAANRRANSASWAASHPYLLVALGLLVAATVAVYAPVFDAGFIDFDDYDYVHGNPHVATGLTWENVYWALTRYHSSNWHPLTWISHMLDVEWFGLDARGHHVVNLVLHVVNVVLLFLMLRGLTGQAWPSFVVAGLFALHPINVETVAWISQRKSTLSTLLAILAIWSYAGYARSGSRRWYALSLAWFALSLLSKQMFVTLPFALLLLDYWPLRRAQLEPPHGAQTTVRSLCAGWWRLFPEKLPYLALAVGASAVILVTQQDAIVTVEAFPLLDRLSNVGTAYLRYVANLSWPANLAIFYPRHADDAALWKVLGSLAVLTAATCAMYWFGRQRRYLLVGWLWFLGTLVPVIGIVHVGLQAMADRYAYVTVWGLFVAVVWLAWEWIEPRWPQRRVQAVAAAAVLVLLVTLGRLTYLQARTWHNTIALFEQAVAATDRNWLAHRTLAEHYFNEQNYERTLYHCRAALELNQSVHRLLTTYGLTLFELGQTEEALEALREATQIAPADPMPWTSLGWALAALGRHEEALDVFAVAAGNLRETSPPYAYSSVYTYWGNALSTLSRLEEALEKYEVAIAHDARHDFLLRAAGEVDLVLGNTDRAVDRLRRAVEVDPRDAKAALLLGRAYAQQGQLGEAADMFEQALALDPSNLDAVIQWARVVYRQGRQAEAQQQLLGIVDQIGTDNREPARMAASTLLLAAGDLAFSAGDRAAAVDHYERAIARWNDNGAAHNNLAWILATDPDRARRDPLRAITLAQHACKLTGHRDPTSLGTLAAAYAANGELPRAVETARAALDVAAQTSDVAASEQLTMQLKRYEAGQPYIDQ